MVKPAAHGHLLDQHSPLPNALETATNRLRDCVESAWAGKGRIVALSGEPASERARLIDEVAAGALDRRIEVSSG